MSDDQKKKAAPLTASDRPLKNKIEERLMEGNWKVMYVAQKDSSPGSPGDGDDGDGGSGGSNSSSGDSNSSSNSTPG